MLTRAFAARSIAELQGAEFVTAIESASKTETEENGNADFSAALLAFGEDRHFPRLLKFLASSDYHVRCAAANALSVANLTRPQLKEALEAVTYAARPALAIADESTMERVEKAIRDKVQGN